MDRTHDLITGMPAALVWLLAFFVIRAVLHSFHQHYKTK